MRLFNTSSSLDFAIKSIIYSINPITAVKVPPKAIEVKTPKITFLLILAILIMLAAFLGTKEAERKALYKLVSALAISCLSLRAAKIILVALGSSSCLASKIVTLPLIEA